jgi:predicted secreted protein
MTAPAATRLTGDLAQTSVGLTGTQTQTLGLQEWTIDKKAKMVDSTTTDDAGHETSLASTDSWTAKAKYAYIDSDTSQASAIFNALSSAQAAVQWNFFPTPLLGRGVWSGKAFVDGYTLTAGVGKLIAVDISLKGTGPLTFGVQLAPASGVAEE